MKKNSVDMATAMDGMFALPPNSFVEALIASGIVFGRGAVGENWV